MNLIDYIILFGMFLSFIALINIAYLKHTKLKEAEILFRGNEIMTTNYFTAGIACLQYGGAFVSRWMAKRSHMLEAREKIPQHIKKYFVFHFWLVLVASILMFGLLPFTDV